MYQFSKSALTYCGIKWHPVSTSLHILKKKMIGERYSKFAKIVHHVMPESTVELMYCSTIFSCGKKVSCQQFPRQIVSCSSSCSSLRGFCTMEGKKGIQKNISALQAKKRIPKKKSIVDGSQAQKDKWLTIAYSSAEEYDLHSLLQGIKKRGIYKVLPLPEDADGVLHVSANYQLEKEPRQIYFFSEGSVVFWNVPDLEQKSVLEFLKQFEVNSYNEHLVMEEKEVLEFIYDENQTRFSNGQIVLNSTAGNDLETFTFSNGMALSVKLALWEASLDSFVDSIEWVTENMKYGRKLHISRENIFQKRGELFALRHVINLSSDLLDTPDFYWDRQKLEVIYQQIYNHLNISKRTKVMNERLNYCSELIDLLSNHMNDKHHVRLEWMIIILILVEVMFECTHFVEKFTGS